MVFADGVGDVLEEVCFTGARRGDDECALALANGREHVEDARGVVDRVVLEDEALLRIEGREVVEEDFFARFFGRFEVDLLDLEEGEELFVLVGRAYATVDRVACAQIKSLDLRWRDVDVVGTGKVVVVDGTKESKALGQRFEDAFAPNFTADARLCLEYAVDELLTAEIGCVFDIERGGFFEQLRNVHAFYVFNKHDQPER